MEFLQETLVNQNHPRSAMTQMHQLQVQRVLCDLTLLTKDGGNFPVHKLVMVSGSDYFKALLDKGMLNAEGLIMHDITGVSLQQLIQYLYTGVACVNKYTIMQLYTAASQLSITSLKSLCRDYVGRNAKLMGLGDDLLDEMKTVWAREDALAKQNKETPQSMVTSPIGGNTGIPGPVQLPAIPVTNVSANETSFLAGKVVYYQEEPSAQDFPQKAKPGEEVVHGIQESPDAETGKQDVHEIQRSQAHTEESQAQLPASQEPTAEAVQEIGVNHVNGADEIEDVENAKENQIENLRQESDSKVAGPVHDYGELETTEDDDEDEKKGGTTEKTVLGKHKKGSVSFKANVNRKRGRPKSTTEPSKKLPVRTTRASAKRLSKAQGKVRKTKMEVKPVEKRHPMKLTIRKVDVTDYNKCICSVCGDQFSHGMQLKVHKLKEHGLVASSFGMHFFTSKYKRIKYFPKRNNGLYLCNTCGDQYPDLSSYLCHEIKKHPKNLPPITIQPKLKFNEKPCRKYSCQICEPQRYFLHLNVLRKHNSLVHADIMNAEDVHTENKQLSLMKTKENKRLCPSVLTSRSETRKITCQLCDAVMQTQADLATHLQQEHDVYTLAHNKCKIKLQCPDCRKACAGNRNTYKLLRKHIRSAHGTDIARQCFYCGRIMNSRTSLNHHLKSSHRILPSIMRLDPIMKQYIVGGEKLGLNDGNALRCHYCRKAVATDSDLAEHLRKSHAQFASFTLISAKDEQKSYDCQRCHRVFKNVEDIQEHFVLDHGPGRRNNNKGDTSVVAGVFVCREDECFVETETESEMAAHMQDKHENVKYDCPMCQFTTCFSYKLEAHLPKHSSKFICNICGKECKKNFALKTHKFRKHDIRDDSLKVHHCEYDGCRFTCFQKSSLKGHMIKHQKDKPFTCPTCGRSLKTAQSLEMHQNKVHKGIRPYICEVCGRAFSKQCEIRAHVRMHSSDRLKCEHCKFSTMNKYSLISHLLSRHNIQVRENEKLFQCPMCDYKTMREKHLTNHINSHLNVRDFVCSKCGKSFVSANSLRGHNNWVHSEKKYCCEFCSYRGGSLSNLKQHVRIMHTQRGLKPYKCAYCDFRCELSGNCRVHCRSAHKGLDVKWVKVVDFNLDLPKKGSDDEDYEEELPSMVTTPGQQVTTLTLTEAQMAETPLALQGTTQVPIHIPHIEHKKDDLTEMETHEIHELRDLRDIAAEQEELGRQSATPGTSHTSQTILYQAENAGATMYTDPNGTLYLSEPLPTGRTPYYPTDTNLYDGHRVQMYLPQEAHSGHLYQHHDAGSMYTN